MGDIQFNGTQEEWNALNKNKEQQKKLIVEIMQADEKDGLYDHIGYTNKMVTAVEWLIKEFSDILGPIDTKPIQVLLMVDAIKKAKQMEKEQIEKYIDEALNAYGIIKNK